MSILSGLKPERVFAYFEELSAIPRGSGNMEGVANYCMAFAAKRSLKAIKDSANNVVIYKAGTAGYETAAPVILQGHLDIVCQKDADCDLDFLTDGLRLYVDGDFVKARGTTLGADNGIAVAMILAILESENISHPPLEAVFTTDEEIGMIGAGQLDMSVLCGKTMINLDAEDDDTLTVSCAGGSDFVMTVPVTRRTVSGTMIDITLKGLKGGHSGVEINSGRVNADMLAGRILNHMKHRCDFDLISIDGGDKGNAIPNQCTARVCVCDVQTFVSELQAYLDIVNSEIAQREPAFSAAVTVGEAGDYRALDTTTADKLIYVLTCAPNGVMEMSASIAGLVESSLNLGVLKTDEDAVTMHFTLRSNKRSALAFLEDKLLAFSACIPCKAETFGYYPPWEFQADSPLQALYKRCYREQHGCEPKVEAIHAGLECGLFASKIEGLDCIAIGPSLADVHTVNERLGISSTEQTYKLLLKLLEHCR